MELPWDLTTGQRANSQQYEDNLEAETESNEQKDGSEESDATPEVEPEPNGNIRPNSPTYFVLSGVDTWRYGNAVEENQTRWASPQVAVWNMPYHYYKAGLLPSNPHSPLLILPMPHRLEYLLNMPPANYEAQLEHGWNPEDCSHHISLLDDDKLTLTRYPVIQVTDCIRGKVGYTKGLHVWEIHWAKCERGTNPVIGVATKRAPLMTEGYKNLVGDNDQSWGWDLNKKKLYHGTNNKCGRRYPVLLDHDESFTVPDKFLVVLDMDNGNLSFIVDGQYLGVAFLGLCGYKLYPIVNTVWGQGRVTMKYFGSLDTQPLPLLGLCRNVIRSAVGLDQLEERVSELNLPHILEDYLLNKAYRC